MLNKKLTRRQMIRLLAGGTSVLLFSDLLVTCGGGGDGSNGSGGNNSSGKITVSGSVDTSQIGGTNLIIRSATSAASPVAQNGAFSTSISTNGNQLQFVTDGSGKIRALAVSNPSNTDPLSIDATSTALALLLLTPGILTTSPSEFADQVHQLQSLGSFSALQSYLATNLPTTALQDLITQTNLPQLIESCILDWMNNVMPSVKLAQPVKTSADGSLSAQFSSLDPLTNASVKLTNSAWCVFQVAREPLDSGQNVLSPAILANTSFGKGYLIGVAPTSWKSLFNRTVNNPGTDFDPNIDLTNPVNQAFIKYFAYGPGKAAPTDTFPLDKAASNAYGLSVLYYVGSPLFDLINGGGVGPSSVIDDLANLWDAIKGSINNGNNGSSTSDIFKDVLSILGTVASSGTLLSLFGLSAIVGPILGLVKLVLVPINFFNASSSWEKLPEVVAVKLPTPIGIWDSSTWDDALFAE